MGSEEDKIIRSVENVISAVGQLVGDIRNATEVDGRSKAFALERVGFLASELDQINRALFLNELPENLNNNVEDGDNAQQADLAPATEVMAEEDSAIAPFASSEPVGGLDENALSEEGAVEAAGEGADEPVEPVKPRLVLTPVASAKADEPVVKEEPVVRDVAQAETPYREECDLTLIDGIDEAMVALLHGEDIFEFKDIAAFKEADMLRISELFSDPCRVSRQNWIEQAALLATGGLTHYASVALGNELFDRTSWAEAYESGQFAAEEGFVAPIGFVPPVDAEHIVEPEPEPETEFVGRADVETEAEPEAYVGSGGNEISDVQSSESQLNAERADGAQDDVSLNEAPSDVGDDDDELTKIILARKLELETELRQLREKQARQQKARDERVKDELVRQGKYSQEQLQLDREKEKLAREELVTSEAVVSDAQPLLKEQDFRDSVDAFVEELSRPVVMTAEEPGAGENELVAAMNDDGAGDGLPSDVEAIWHEEVSTAADYVPPVVDDEDFDYGSEDGYGADDGYDAGEQYFADEGYEGQEFDTADAGLNDIAASAGDAFVGEHGEDGFDEPEYRQYEDEYPGEVDGGEPPVVGSDGIEYSESDIAVPQNDGFAEAAFLNNQHSNEPLEMNGQQGDVSDLAHFDNEISTAKNNYQYGSQDQATEPFTDNELPMSGQGDGASEHHDDMRTAASGLEFEINEPKERQSDFASEHDGHPVEGIQFEDNEFGFSEDEALSKPLGAYLARSGNEEGGAVEPGARVARPIIRRPISPEQEPAPVSLMNSTPPAFVPGDRAETMQDNPFSNAPDMSAMEQSANGAQVRDDAELAVRKPMAPPRMSPPAGGPPPLHHSNGNATREIPQAPHIGGEGRVPPASMKPMAPPMPPQGGNQQQGRPLNMPSPEGGQFTQGRPPLRPLPQGHPLQEQTAQQDQMAQQGGVPNSVPPHMAPPPNRMPPQGMMPPPAPSGDDHRGGARNGAVPESRSMPVEDGVRDGARSMPGEENFQSEGATFSPPPHSQISVVDNEQMGNSGVPMPPRRSRVVRGPEYENQGDMGADGKNVNGTWDNYWGDALDASEKKEPATKLGFREKAKKFAQSLQRNFTDDNG